MKTLKEIAQEVIAYVASRMCAIFGTVSLIAGFVFLAAGLT
jgi:hypothetical protein